MKKNLQSETLSNTGKMSLGAKLGILLKAKYGELKRASTELGLRYATLRQDLWQNRFLETDLHKLCSAVELPSDISLLSKSYDFDLKQETRGIRKLERELASKIDAEKGNLADVFRSLEGRMDRLRYFVESAKEIIPQFFHCLSGADVLVIFISDNLPVHWGFDEEEVGDWITLFANKISSGAHVLYLYPNDDLCTNIRKNGHPMMLSCDQVEESFIRFRNALLNKIGQKFIDILNNNLFCIKHDCPHVCIPQHRYVLYFYNANKKPQVRCTGTYPISYQHGKTEKPSDYLVVPLNIKFTNLLKQACITSLEKNNDKNYEKLLYKINGNA